MTFSERVIGAAKLDPRVYKEVEADPLVTLAEVVGAALRGPAFLIVVLCAALDILQVFAYLPLLGGIVRFAVWLWLIMTTVMAVRQALDYRSTVRAVAVCLIAPVVGFVIRMILAARAFIF